ncbi:MAG: hypothetical protein ACPGXK_08960, partial [Phycisphaerae bacterium]
VASTPLPESTSAGDGDVAALLEQLRLRELAIEKREAELRDRERLLLQRWTKLLSTRCRQCGTPVKIQG